MKENLNKKQPIFIVGMPRSGTTLMSTILSAHPSIAISPQTKFLTKWMRQYPDLDISQPRDFQMFWEYFSQGKNFSHIGIDSEATLSRILEADKIDYYSIFDAILQEYAIKMKKYRFGEKTPSNYEHVDLLLKWYPQARIIWLVRDPRAVTASLLAVPWGSSYADVHAIRWRNSIHLINKDWARDERVKIVKYETLVTEPETVIKQVCQFIGEEYTPAMISERSEVTSPIINRDDWSNTYLKSALRPIDKDTIERWRVKLSLYNIAVIEHITRREMHNWGYKPITNNLTPWQSTRWFMTKAFRNSQQKLKHRLFHK